MAARADTITVTSLADDGSPGTLREAISGAPAGSTIVVPAGTITLEGGELDIGKSLTITGAGPAATAISGGGVTRVWGVSGSGTSLTLSQLTVRDGASIAPGSIAEGGGMVIVSAASVTLTHVAFTDNVAKADGFGGIGEGGGIYSNGPLAIEDSTFTGNAALSRGSAGDHGGVAAGGAIQVNSGTLSIARSKISGNTAIGTGGTGPPNPSQSGGIAQGGGILALVPLSLTDSTVSGNVADASAGPGGSAGTGSAAGGGLQAQLGSGQTTAISNSTIAGNVTKLDVTSGPSPATGGGLDTIIASGGTLTIRSSTIAGNTAPSGGNIDPTGAGTQKVASSIVAGGTGLAGQENCSAPLTSLGHNVDSLNQCGFNATGDLTNTDPRLGPLQDNGGPGPTLGFGMDSPAFNAGDPATCPAADERGVARPQGAGCDVGAFELELADLGLRSSASDEHLNPGQTVTIALNGFNGGSGFGHATTIVDRLPVGLAFVSAKPSSGTCVGTRTISCTIGEVAPGAPGGVQIVARATKPGAQVSSTSIASSTVDPAGGNNAASVAVTVNKLRMAVVALSPRRFRLGSLRPKLSKVRTGATIRFTLPEAARVKLSFARKHGKRFRAAGSFTVRGHSGKNKLRFQGRLSRRKSLKPGRYRLTLRATDRFGNRSQSKKLNFTLLP